MFVLFWLLRYLKNEVLIVQLDLAVKITKAIVYVFQVLLGIGYEESTSDLVLIWYEEDDYDRSGSASIESYKYSRSSKSGSAIIYIFWRNWWSWYSIVVILILIIFLYSNFCLNEIILDFLKKKVIDKNNFNGLIMHTLQHVKVILVNNV